LDRLHFLFFTAPVNLDVPHLATWIEFIFYFFLVFTAPVNLDVPPLATWIDFMSLFSRLRAEDQELLALAGCFCCAWCFCCAALSMLCAQARGQEEEAASGRRRRPEAGGGGGAVHRYIGGGAR
jgi:hypothetical protein